MTANPKSDHVSSRSWMKILLFISLAINLLIVGLVAGSFIGKPPSDRNPLLRQIGFGPFVKALPRADKRAITERLKQQSGSFQQNRREMREGLAQILDVLRAEPFDQNRLESLIMTQNAKVVDRTALGQSLLLERIGTMSAPDRAAYADALEEELTRRGPRFGGGPHRN